MTEEMATHTDHRGFAGASHRVRKLELRAKITLVILGVLVPTFILLTFAVDQFLQPSLLKEIQQIGISTGKTLSDEIVAQRWFSRPNAEIYIEKRLREFLYLQPNIRRIEVFQASPETGENHLIASTIEEDPADRRLPLPASRQVHSELHTDEDPGENGWEISVPILSSGSKEARILGSVHLFVSIQLAKRLGNLLVRVTLVAGLIGMIILFFVLNTALRRTIENDRKLTQAERENAALSEQLRESERSLLRSEKLAAMGQLTASFAHEIGTPLNAIGGHLSLLKEDTANLGESARSRFAVIEGQLAKITDIVRGFLQNTSKPASQRQLIDPHVVIDRTLGIVRPRAEALAIRVERDYDRHVGPIRVVPLELEQVLLNLVTNSLDSLSAKRGESKARAGLLKLTTSSVKHDGRDHLAIAVRDTGEGISKKDLPQIWKPFFTTKAPGEGTGLGLAICQDIARKYGGSLSVDSVEGEWTEIKIELPYAKEAGGTEHG